MGPGRRLLQLIEWFSTGITSAWHVGSHFVTHDHDDADDFPTPVPGPRRNPTRVILVVFSVVALLGLIVCAGPFGWVWKRAVGAGE